MVPSLVRRSHVATRSRSVHVALWIAQSLLSITFVGGAIWKLVTPRATLAAMMPWVGDVPPAFFVFTAIVDLAGGLGIVLPSLTGIRPRLTVAAAVGCALLQGLAIAFHLARGEAANTPFNVLLLALAAFVIWGRRARTR